MTTYQLINHLEACNLLAPLIECGAIPLSLKRKRDIYQYYEKEIFIGKEKTTAITHTADALKVEENYVYRALKVMSQELKSSTAHNYFT